MPLTVDDILQRIDSPQNRLIGASVLAVCTAATLAYALRAIRRRRQRRQLHEAIVAAGVEYLRDVLVPDGMEGSMHVDYLLLTSRGVVVIDLRDVKGNIFGGDQMTQWTVMSGADRTTFPNPQHALYDRVAAVKQFAGELPVEGRILFTRKGRFPKGLPRWTLMVDSLRTEFPPPDSEATQSWVDGYREQWRQLCASVTESPLRRHPHFLAEVFLE
ncbi:MAG: nuclease-related domain-containing protein [Steroidobacteraceae bacterium]